MATRTFGAIDPAGVAAERDALARLIGDLGHARSFSLDTDVLVQERADGLRT